MLGKILKLWENCYLIILSIHILKLEISGCDRYTLGISSGLQDNSRYKSRVLINTRDILRDILCLTLRTNN
jgi:hypothetical protein